MCGRSHGDERARPGGWGSETQWAIKARVHRAGQMGCSASKAKRNRKANGQVGVGRVASGPRRVQLWVSLPTPTPSPTPAPPAGGNRITQAVQGAHDGGVFALCALRDGTLVSGGGRDRRVVLWGSDYSKMQEVEVRPGNGGWPRGILARPLPSRAPNSGLPRARVIPAHLAYPAHASTHSGPGGLWPCTHRGRGQGRHAVRGDHP